jgi:hypothetical protein
LIADDVDGVVHRVGDTLAERVLAAEVPRGPSRCEHTQSRTHDLYARRERLDDADDPLEGTRVSSGIVGQHFDVRTPSLSFAPPHPATDPEGDRFGRCRDDAIGEEDGGRCVRWKIGGDYRPTRTSDGQGADAQEVTVFRRGTTV